MLNSEIVTKAVIEIIRKAETKLPTDVSNALKKALENETSQTAIAQLNAIIKNVETAKENSVPMCQDTGTLIFYVEIGRDALIDFDIKGAIIEGVKQATEIVPLRPNAVHPITRINSGDNTGDGQPDINYDFVDGDKLKITVLPKGAGSENMSSLEMLMPSNVKDIEKTIINAVFNAGGKPCPPVIVGVGIGGGSDKALKMAKRALLRELGHMSEDEQKLTDKINSMGIGPMGLGGETTVLAVHIKKAHCHTAILPIGIIFSCWAMRRVSITLDLGGKKDE